MFDLVDQKKENDHIDKQGNVYWNGDENQLS